MASVKTTAATRPAKASLRDVCRAHPEAWEARALELAYAVDARAPWWIAEWKEARGLSRLDALGIEHFRLPSQSRAVTHLVTFDASREMGAARVRCDCEAGMVRMPCWHAGMVLRWIALMAREFSPEAEAERVRAEKTSELIEEWYGGRRHSSRNEERNTSCARTRD